MKTVAIFSGTFDPFTMAHRNIVEQVLKSYLADDVYIVPTIVNYHREGKESFLKDVDKLNIIKCLVEDIDNSKEHVFIDSYELGLLRQIPGNVDAFQKRRRFIDTLVEFKQRHFGFYDEIKLKFIIGTDEYKAFKNWTMWDTILQIADPIVVNGRDGDEVVTEFNCDVINIDPKYANVSASAVRKALAEGLSIQSYIKDALGYRTLVTTPIFRVRQAKVDGAGFDPIQVVSNDWVSILAKHEPPDQPSQFKVVKQVRYGLERPFMEFPCGIIENGEKPEDAAVRELEEETGIRLTTASKDLVFLGKVPTNPAFMTNYMYYYYVNLDSSNWTTVGQHLDEHEKIVVGDNDIDDLFYRALNTNHDPSLETPALMCTALFLYDHYKKYPSFYKQGVPNEQVLPV